MAIVNTPWINNDGLRIRFDQDKISQVAPRGEAPGAGEDRVIDFIIDVKTLKASESNIIEGTFMPAKSFITEVWVTHITEVKGTTAINVGTLSYNEDGSVSDKHDSILKGLALADVPVGLRKKILKGDTGAGDIVGTITKGLQRRLTIRPTGQGTDGEIGVRVHIFVPQKTVTIKSNSNE